MNEETDLGVRLSALAEAPAPVSKVDVHEAQRRGRARLMRRRVAVLTAVTAVVATSVALATLRPGGASATGPAARPSLSPSPSGSGSSRQVPTPGAPTSTPSDGRTLAPFSGSDPLVQDARFGWLPDSVKTMEYSLQPNGPSVRAEGDPGQNDPVFTVRVYPEGVTPELRQQEMYHEVRVDGPQVNGREAYWVSADKAGFVETHTQLRWKTADGRWGELGGTSVPEKDREQVLLKVAAGVTTGHWQIPLPLRITGLPESYTVSSVTLDQQLGGGPFSMRLTFAAAADKYFTTSVGPDAPEPTRTQPNGMPVQERPHACKSEHGLKVCVTPLQGPEMLAPVGGTDGWLSKVTTFGTDQSKWTTDVLG